jgi:hypothetical protein
MQLDRKEKCIFSVDDFIWKHSGRMSYKLQKWKKPKTLIPIDKTQDEETLLQQSCDEA